MEEYFGSSLSENIISVAMCTHNGEKFIGEQIHSILHQTLPVNEIVLSDDASTDRTVKIVEHSVAQHLKFHGSAPKLTVLKNITPLGVTKNFEQALLQTSGRLIALSDQDDVWHPDKVKKLSQFFQNPKVLFVFSNARQTDQNNSFLGHDLFEALALSHSERASVIKGESYKQFMRRNLATGATVMLRRSLVDSAVPFPEPWLHDEWLALVASAFNGVKMTDVMLIDYRQHSRNLVGMSPIRARRKFSMFLEPRTDRNMRLYLRAQALSNRIGDLKDFQSGKHVQEKYQLMAKEKYLFEQKRMSYPESRIKRIFPICQQLLLGRYSKYGTGAKDAIRNLIQPV